MFLKVGAVFVLASFLTVSLVTVFHKHDVKQQIALEKETVGEAEFCKICDFIAHFHFQDLLAAGIFAFAFLAISLPQTKTLDLGSSIFDSFLQGFTNKGPPTLV